MKKELVTFDDILNERSIPAAAINQQGIFFLVNNCFENEYGWREGDLKGNVITEIIPPYMRDAHNLGFSRFLTTGEHRILDKEIPLPVLCKDGSIRDAMHFITAKKISKKWKFAALIKPA